MMLQTAGKPSPTDDGTRLAEKAGRSSGQLLGLGPANGRVYMRDGCQWMKGELANADSRKQLVGAQPKGCRRQPPNQ